jgi:hypothetical protein
MREKRILRRGQQCHRLLGRALLTYDARRPLKPPGGAGAVPVHGRRIGQGGRKRMMWSGYAAQLQSVGRWSVLPF